MLVKVFSDNPLWVLEHLVVNPLWVQEHLAVLLNGNLITNIILNFWLIEWCTGM